MRKKSLFLGIVSILLLVIVFLPSFFSTKVGKKILLNIVNHNSNIELKIETLSLSWFGPQQATKVELINPKLSANFRAKSIITSAPLWDLIKENPHLGETKIHEPYLELKEDFRPPIPFKRIKNIDSAPILQGGFLFQSKPEKAFLGFSGNIEIEQGNVIILARNSEITHIEQLNAEIHLPKEKFPIYLSATGNTQQDQISGNFNIETKIQSIQLQHPEFDIMMRLHHFPIQGIDEAFSFFEPSWKGLFVQALGPSIDLDLDAKWSDILQDLNFHAESLNLQANIQTTSQNQIVTLQNPAKILFTIQPEFVSHLFSKFPGIHKLAMDHATILEWSISEFSLPFAEKKPDLPSLQLSSQLKLTPTTLFPSIQLQSFHSSIFTQKLGEKLNIQAQLLLNGEVPNSRLVFNGEFQKLFSQNYKGSAKLDLKQFPIALLDQLFFTSNQLEKRFGNVIETALNWNASLKAQTLQIKADTPYAKFSDVNFDITTESATLREPFHIQSVPPVSMTGFYPFNLQITRFSFPDFEHLDRMLLTAQGSFSKILLSHLELEKLQMQLSVDTWDKIQLDVSGDSLQANLEGAFSKKEQVFVLSKPLNITGEFSNENLKQLLPSSLTLANPIHANLSIDPTSFKFSENFFQQLKLQAHLFIDKIALLQEKIPMPDALHQIQARINIDSPQKNVNFQLQASSEKSEEHLLDIHASCEDFDVDRMNFSELICNFDVHIKNLSLDLLEKFLNVPNQVLPLLGTSMNLELKGKRSSNMQVFDIDLFTQNFKFKGSVIQKNNVWELDAPLHGEWTLTSQGYVTLHHTLNPTSIPKYLLKNPMQWNLTIDQLQIPFSIDDSLHLQVHWPQMIFNGKMESGPIEWSDSIAKQNYLIQQILVKLERPDETSPFVFDFMGMPQKKQDAYSIHAKLDVPFSNLDVETHLQKFPISFLELIIPATPFQMIFGEYINFDSSLHLQNMSGPFQLSFSSTNIRVSSKGEILNGVMKLSEPIHAQMVLTKELSRSLLKEVNPLSISSMNTTQPITIEITPKDFSFPIYPFDWNQLNIDQARIELGQLRCENEGNLNIALGLLKQNFSKGTTLDLWFAPIDCKIQKQIASVERTEILLDNSLEICIFGKMNLERDYVDMILGLTAQCLKKAFGIKELPANYVLQIPLKGPLNQVTIDTSKATAKIAALLLWQKGSGALGELGPAGVIAGDLVGKLATLPDRNAETPSAKHPFPWEQKKLKSEVSSKKGKRIKLRKKEKPLKQLYKLLK